MGLKKLFAKLLGHEEYMNPQQREAESEKAIQGAEKHLEELPPEVKEEIEQKLKEKEEGLKEDKDFAA